jgi:hypothetical protein
MTDGELAEKYGEVCDIIHRTLCEWPLDRDDPDDPGFGRLYTSDEARAAAIAIFEIMGFGEELRASHNRWMEGLTPEQLKNIGAYLDKQYPLD